MQKTQVIAGHEITLEAGVRYYASRPMLTAHSHLSDRMTVSIKQNFGDKPGAEIPGLTYDQANELIKAFNNGAISFVGRVW